ncbi:MAG: hypothetical protein JXB38_03990, partial [Anaerolineales bacterium]|nr:hypothetical protein [Anaerolineales bacterium]
LWAWTMGHFLWQSMAFNPTMRYQLPIYPPMAVYAGWTVVALWDLRESNGEKLRRFAQKWARPLAVVVGGGILLATLLYAFAFTRIYTRPVTRVEATRWIYQNIPGPISLPIASEDETVNQQISVPYGLQIAAGQPFFTSFIPKQVGELSQINIKKVVTPNLTKDLTVRISEAGAAEEYILDAPLTLDVAYHAGQVNTFTYIPEAPVLLSTGLDYILRLELPAEQGQQMVEYVELNLLDENGLTFRRILEQPQTVIGGTPFLVAFTAESTATIAELSVGYYTSAEPLVLQHALRVLLSEDPSFDQVLASGSLQVDTSLENLEGYTVDLDNAIRLQEGLQYYIQIVVEEGGPIELYGSALANESTWDDGLPLRMDGYDGYGGIYQQDLVLELYWDANVEKRDRMQRILDDAEYLLISSSRVWASTPRIPERFPLAVTYYRNLLGCPQDKSIEWCYNVADVGKFEGNLGYELVQVFQSDPTLGPWRINDQPSEEAFTVYDHPKVFIFKKTADYDSNQVSAILEAVDLTKVNRLTPKQASRQPLNIRSLMLGEESLERQRTGGTWSELFNSSSIFNSFQPAGVLLWYLAVLALGLSAYPLVRVALPGLSDRGYPLARAAGMLLLSYGSWVAGSLGISFIPLTIAVVWVLILLAAAVVVYRKREEFAEEWRGKKKYFLIIEGLFLALFLAGLLIRMANPDLWHPAKGGEKPMNLSYFTAVLKSTTFPPYDPWYAGGYLNYYYYGYVYVGALVKLLGIMPVFAYNLVLPTLFSMIAMGAFSCAWNLYLAYRHWRDGAEMVSPWIVGGSAGLLMAILGNLGSIRMILRGYARLGAGRLGAQYETTALFFKQVWWGANGLIEAISGGSLPYGFGDWYWFPSRVIDPRGDVEPITEFPMFTFLYADLHAHLIVLPIALLALAWVLSVVLGRAWEEERKPLTMGWSFVFGGLAISLLLPTNTWDYPLYLALGILAVIYACLRYFRLARFEGREFRFEGIAAAVGGAALLFLLFKVFALPFTHWFFQGYSNVEMWQGSNTYLKDYLTHWGVYLFIILSWLLWETRQWLAHTPVKALRKLVPYLMVIAAGLLVAAIALVVLQVMDVRAAWVVLPFGLLTAILLLRPNYPDNKRVALFLLGSGLFLTLMVEIIVLTGDIGRMNTVFKFYLQVWTLYAVIAAAAVGWLLSEIRLWRPSWRIFWQVGLALLVASAALFPLLATAGKIKDRMAPDAPVTLNGMTYMQYAKYGDQGETFDLKQDYDAIRWMQENVSGSPVIVEGNTPEYRWGSRFTIYTGLPGVVGWNWHQRQQRGAVVGLGVEQRVSEVGAFYNTTNLEEALSFLRRYNVKYIVVGQLERAYHPGEGLDKFEAQDGVYWQEVYRTGDTVIYEVLDETLAME